MKNSFFLCLFVFLSNFNTELEQLLRPVLLAVGQLDEWLLAKQNVAINEAVVVITCGNVVIVYVFFFIFLSRCSSSSILNWVKSTNDTQKCDDNSPSERLESWELSKRHSQAGPNSLTQLKAWCCSFQLLEQIQQNRTEQNRTEQPIS